MTAPIPSAITLPIDTSNAGKNIRTETKVIGGTTVHEQFVVPNYALTITGKYFFSSSQQSVQTSAQDGTSTAFFWLENPIGGTITAQIRRASIDCSAAAATAAPTAPVVSFTKFTFTGSAAGAAVVPLPFQTAGVANQLSIRTAVTGMTVTKVADVCGFNVPAILTAVGQYRGQEELLTESSSYGRQSELEIAPGEGLVIWQSVAGTASDPRRFNVQVEWFEIDLT